MDKKILNDILSAEPFREQSAEELTKELDAELAKANPDYDLVDELTAAILEARGKSVNVTEDEVEAEIVNIKRKANIKKHTFRCPKWVVGLSAACVMLVVANTVSVAALGKNIFSAAIEFTKGGFSVDFGKQEQDGIELPTSEDDPYGFIAKLAEYDIEFETPHYIPDGFVLTDVETNVNEGILSSVRFIYFNGKQNFSLDFTKHLSEIGSYVIPSDHYNISEIDINGTKGIVSKEDNQYTLAYNKDDVVFIMFCDGVSYDECEKIVNSIK